MPETQVKPQRPFGLTLALLLSGLLFTARPIVEAWFVLRLRQRMTTNLAGLGEGGPILGGTLFDIPAWVYVVQIVLALVFLGVLVLAWRGRPPVMRVVLVMAVLVMTAVTLVLPLLGLLTSTQFRPASYDSGQSVQQALVSAQYILTALIVLYVLWYVNRGPSRAFYRGYYLPEPEAQTGK